MSRARNNADLGDNYGTFSGTIGSNATGFGLITMFDQFYLENSFTGGSTTITPWTRVTASTHSGYSPLNTGLTQNSGVFSFPTTGLYLVQGSFTIQEVSGGDDNIGGRLQVTIDNTTYKTLVQSISEVSTTQTTGHFFLGPTVINCTNTSNVKFRWLSNSVAPGNEIRGTDGEQTSSQDVIYTTFSAMRIGTSQ